MEETRDHPAVAAAVTAMRAALHSTRQENRDIKAAAESAMQRLIQRTYRPLLRYCAALLRSAPALQNYMEPEDLAQEAWRKSLQYLGGANGEKVQDDAHFENLLRRAARTRLLDALDEIGHALPATEMDAPVYHADGEAGTRGERLADTHQPTPEELLLPRDGSYLLLVEELFTDPNGFHRRHRQENQRQPRQYQALVLYQIAALLREQISACAEPQALPGGNDSSGGDPLMARRIRHYAALLGIPEESWRRVEQAAGEGDKAVSAQQQQEESAPERQLLEAVNEICGTKLRTQAQLSVLRHEMNRFAETM